MLIYLILDKLGKKLEMNKKFREDISTRFLIDLFMIYILFSSYFAMVFVIYNFVLVPMIKQGSVFEFLNQIFKPIPNDALIIIELILITPSLIALGLLYYILKKIMMTEEPPYETIAWFFYKIDERQRQIYELIFDIDQKLAKVKDLLNEIDILKAQLETNVNVEKI
jgi:predicted signal transduction protein with EAL and GGDEF domain